MFGSLHMLLAALCAPRLGRRRSSHTPRLSFDHLESRLAPATFTVTNISDAGLPPARGLELRQAIALADVAANAGSTINFAVNGTIILAQGELNITQPMTIEASTPLHTITINGAAKSRVFSITTAGTVSLTDLIINNGNSSNDAAAADGLGNGGGIYVASPNSNLVLNGATIEVNTAFAPTTPTGGGNGGGVYSRGTVTLNNSLVEANAASKGDGGGIFAANNITLNGSTASNDSALLGGGIYQAGTGTTVTLSNATVTANKALGGSGGGVWAFYDVAGTGSAVTDNLALSGGNGGGIFSATGNITDPGIISGNTATGAGGGLWAQFDVVLSGAIISNNVGDVGGGGIWANAGFVTISNTTITGNTAGAGTSGANNNTGDGGGVWSGTDVTIDAASNVTSNLANGNGGGIFALTSVTVNGGTVSNDSAISSLFDQSANPLDGNGGGIYAGLDVNVNGGYVTGNTASLDGGGVYSSAGAVDLNTGAYVSNNTVGADGGGIWDYGGNVAIDSSTITANEAEHGGGLFVSGSSTAGSLSVSNTTISLNTAVVEGGGIFVSLINVVTITASIIDSNTAALTGGGGISAHSVLNLAITDSSVTNNNAVSGSGGGVYVIGPADAYLFGDVLTGNSAGVSGAGVYLQKVTGTIYACTFDDDLSYGGPLSGSDLFVDSNATLDLNVSNFNDTLGYSATLRTNLIDVGNTLPGGTPGVITSSGGNGVWDNSWTNVSNFDFPGSGDVGDEQR